MVLNNIYHLNLGVMLRLSFLCSPDVLPVRWLLQVLLLKKYLPELPLSLQEVWPFQMLRLLLLCRFRRRSWYPMSLERILLRFPESYADLLFLRKEPVKKLVLELRSELPVSSLLNKHQFRKVFRLFRHLRSRCRLLRLYHSRSQDLLSSYVLPG